MKCSDCGVFVEPSALFPMNRCLDCHAVDFDSKPMPTAQEIRKMWGMN